MEKMIFAVILLSIAQVDAFVKYDVLDYGAVGDGSVDDSQAFLRTWKEVCGAPRNSEKPVMLIPPRKTFLVNPVDFRGPCNSTQVDFQIAGEIVAPMERSAWQHDDNQKWISFHDVDGLRVWGHGKVNGRGFNWWQSSCDTKLTQGCTTTAPNAMCFYNCDGLKLTDMSFVDSPHMHVTIVGSDWVEVANLTISAPGDSPQTDGIHLERSQHVSIQHATIRTGDDCISIGNGTYDVNITNIFCGPGHGISVGSLGKDRTRSTVEKIQVSFVHFNGTTNGVRIKTWPGGSGYARSISFENIRFEAVENPIIVDQNYRTRYANEVSAVEVSDIKYMEATGTSTTHLAVNLNCSQALPCSQLLLSNVNLTSYRGGKVSSHCVNVNGSVQGYVSPSVPCLA